MFPARCCEHGKQSSRSHHHVPSRPASTLWCALASGEAAAAAAVLPVAAATRTVTLQVEVRLANYAAGHAAVWCELLDGGGRAMAANLKRVNVSGGAANTTVEVNVALKAALARDARSWRCVLATAGPADPLADTTTHEQGIPAAITLLDEFSGDL